MATKKPTPRLTQGSSKAEVAPAGQQRPNSAGRTIMFIDPCAQAAMTIHDSSLQYQLDRDCLDDVLRAEVEAVNRGDMRRTEAILITQAHTLNELFNSLARSACEQDNLKPRETYLRLALKAQSQCRTTLEALSAIKNPPVVFAKQANVVQGGNQQVNNGVPVAVSHAGDNQMQRNELLEVRDGGENLDTRATGEAVGADPAMATVGEIHGR